MFSKKRIFSLIAFAAIALPSLHAESTLWDGAKSEEKASLSAEIGLNLSQFTHVERWNGIKAGLNIGVMAEKPILNSLSAKAGLFYTMKGTVGKNDGGFGGTLTTTFSPSYLEIPVMASYRYSINDALRFQFDFGPYFAFGLHGKDVKKYRGSGVAGDSDTKIDLFGGDNPQLKRFDFGFRFGPQIVFNNRFSGSLQYEVSAINISKMGGKVGNGNFMINIGYTFATF
ncbi:MAG: PorT family protein [Muribaculaceae bacterium]|nr:PorT family protein [Muribaculaceae bacterium]